ncbi:hypothetical protein PY650_30970 [Rhizobium calliandrae]|uniref:Uncharacterized protein n=1 Tax=Rhizobium calliandrae TaxID=1312182 RepID=A0ABT7KMU3_9HYPH|nr:hypothetical protein [Rhizobium calliandrae]MDL2409962.1 hypothetical protein [Rhizobium calliandrae]
MKMLLAFVAAVVIVPSTATASTKELDTAVMQAAHFSIQPMPKAARAELATAALAYWKSFDSRIPRNAPSVDEWLNKELSSNDSVRVSRVLNAPEYALRDLAELSEECVNSFDLIVQHPAAPVLTELYLWTKTLRCYRSSSGLLNNLQQAGLSDGRYDGPFSIQHFTVYHDTVTGYLANTIIDEAQNAK